MFRTIGQFGITLLVASTWNMASSVNQLVLAKAIASDYPQHQPSRVRLVIDRNGNVVEAQVIEGNASTEYSAQPNGNAVSKDGETSIHSQLAEAALTTARQMKFTPLANKERVVVMVTFNFTIADPNFDRKAHQHLIQNGRDVQVEETNLAPLK